MADKPRQGDLYVPSFGSGVTGGTATFRRDGQHHTAFSDPRGPRFSYDVDRLGNYTGGLHGIDQGVPKGDPGRKW